MYTTWSPPLYATFATQDETPAQLPEDRVVVEAGVVVVVVVVALVVVVVLVRLVVVLVLVVVGVVTVTGVEVVPPFPFWRMAFLMP